MGQVGLQVVRADLRVGHRVDPVDYRVGQVAVRVQAVRVAQVQAVQVVPAVVWGQEARAVVWGREARVVAWGREARVVVWGREARAVVPGREAQVVRAADLAQVVVLGLRHLSSKQQSPLANRRIVVLQGRFYFRRHSEWHSRQRCKLGLIS